MDEFLERVDPRPQEALNLARVGGLERKVDALVELLGESLEVHPLELVADQVSKSGAIPTAEATNNLEQQVAIAGMRQTSRRSRTAKGKPMLFMTLGDLTGTPHVIAFPDVYRTAKDILNSTFPILVTVVIEMDTSRGETYLRAGKVDKLG